MSSGPRIDISNRIEPSAQANPVSQRGPLTRQVNIPLVNTTGRVSAAVTEFSINGSIVPRANEYLVCCSEFEVSLEQTPIYIAPPTPDQSDPNLLTLRLGICYNMTNPGAGLLETVTQYLEYVDWIPQTMGVGVPTQGSAKAVITDYYYAYSIEHIVNLFNATIAAACTTSGVAALIANNPTFSYDATTSLWSLTIPDAFRNEGATARWSVCWNAEVDRLLNNFNTIQNGTDLYIVEDTLSLLTNHSGTNTILTQDGPTIDFFNPVKKILLVTNAVPIPANFFPAVDQRYGQSGKLTVLADKSLDFQNNIAGRGTETYRPDFEEWNDMESPLPIKSIDCRFIWLDNYGNFHDLEISNNSFAQAKLYFKHKSLFGLQSVSPFLAQKSFV